MALREHAGQEQAAAAHHAEQIHFQQPPGVEADAGNQPELLVIRGEGCKANWKKPAERLGRRSLDRTARQSQPGDTENIKRGIQRGTGELPGVSYEEVTYEGYGPGGVAVYIEAMTDNKNRTLPEIRTIFSKHGGNLGAHDNNGSLTVENVGGRADLIDLFDTPHNRKITWDHMLRQVSDWEGTLWGKPEWADRPTGEPSTWATRPRKEPGSAYEYNDVRVNALALAAMSTDEIAISDTTLARPDVDPDRDFRVVVIGAVMSSGTCRP